MTLVCSFKELRNKSSLYSNHLVSIELQPSMQLTWSFVVRYNGWLSTIVVSFKLEDALLGHLNEEVMTISSACFYSVVWLHGVWEGRGISSSDFTVVTCDEKAYLAFKKHGNNAASNLMKIGLHYLWIYVNVPKKCGVHMKSLSWIKNSLKTWNIAVCVLNHNFEMHPRSPNLRGIKLLIF